MSEPTCLNCGAAESEVWAQVTDVEYRTSDEVFTYRRCGACGVLFLEDPPVDRLHEIYPSTYYSYDDDGGGVVTKIKDALDRRTFGALCKRIEGEQLSVLDVGGGTGAQASAVRASDPRVTRSVVVDLDEQCRGPVEAAGHEFVCARIEDYQPDATFDVVLLMNLIEHVIDPRATLAAIGGLLSERGRILVKTPNVDAYDARRYRHRNWGGYHCPRHWVLYDPDSFRAAAASAGLAVEKLDLTQGAPFWAVSTLASLEEKGRLKRPANGALHEHKLFGPVMGAFAAFDFARRPFAKTSQMFATLSKAR